MGPSRVTQRFGIIMSDPHVSEDDLGDCPLRLGRRGGVAGSLLDAPRCAGLFQVHQPPEVQRCKHRRPAAAFIPAPHRRASVWRCSARVNLSPSAADQWVLGNSNLGERQCHAKSSLLSQLRPRSPLLPLLPPARLTPVAAAVVGLVVAIPSAADSAAVVVSAATISVAIISPAVTSTAGAASATAIPVVGPTTILAAVGSGVMAVGSCSMVWTAD